jgi:DUF1680 family protein
MVNGMGDVVHIDLLANSMVNWEKTGKGVEISMKGDRCFAVDTSRSPYARLRPFPISAVRLNDIFWAPRIRRLKEVTIPTQYELLEETGRLHNFRRASKKEGGDFQGLFFNDSDVYKWLEAAALSLASGWDGKVVELMNRVIPEISAAQDEDGYLNTYFTFERKKDRWTNLKDMHELYCAGHLFQAAVAHRRVMGDESFLDVARRFADHIDRTFGPGKKEGACGHPEVEMALVELYRETGDRRYLDLAKFFVDQRGYGKIGGSPYHQDHKPFRDLDEVVGHAVRMLYLNCGAADIYAETGDRSLLDALRRIWRNLAGRRIYVTGGCGARHEGEAFGRDYELPNESAYGETCAAVANVLWNWRMALITGEAIYADMMELSLFNGSLAGIGLDGKSYFYVNPLSDRGGHRRQPFFPCACCPPNIARLIAMVPGLFYSVNGEGIWVHMYAEGTAEVGIGGSSVVFYQHTRYPWDGEVEIVVEPSRPMEFGIFLRIPGWCSEARVSVNGEGVSGIKPGDYIELRREWRKGDEVHIDMAMPAEWIVAHPFVESDGGKVALRRGPIIYCLEQADNPHADVWGISVLTDRPLEAEFVSDLLDGVVVIRGEGMAVEKAIWDNGLYKPMDIVRSASRKVGFVAIPYYAWANREPGPMAVWLPRA